MFSTAHMSVHARAASLSLHCFLLCSAFEAASCGHKVQAAVSRSTVGPAWLPSCWARLCSWPRAVLQCPLLQGSLWGTSAPQTLAKQGGVKVLGRLLTKSGKKWIVLIVFAYCLYLPGTSEVTKLCFSPSHS